MRAVTDLLKFVLRNPPIIQNMSTSEGDNEGLHPFRGDVGLAWWLDDSIKIDGCFTNFVLIKSACRGIP
jgi:hypothetical protein